MVNFMLFFLSYQESFTVLEKLQNFISADFRWKNMPTEALQENFLWGNVTAL